MSLPNCGSFTPKLVWLRQSIHVRHCDAAEAPASSAITAAMAISTIRLNGSSATR